MNTLASEPTASPVAPSAPELTTPIRVFGVGNAGVNLLNTLVDNDADQVSFIAVNTDPVSLATSAAPLKLPLEKSRWRSLDAGNDSEREPALAEHSACLAAACRDAKLVVILTGLGGVTGTGISPVVARMAREAGALALACAVLPFHYEGSRRQHQAQAGLERLRAEVDGLICLPNQKILQLIDERTALLDTFKTANARLTEGLCGLLRLLTHQGLIPIQLPELCALLQGRHVESVLAAAEAHGPNRAREVVDRILAHPLLDGGQALATAEAVVVSLHGGLDLALAEVNRVMEQITRQCETAQVLMGATVDMAFNERLQVTLIATPRNVEVPLAEEAVADEVTDRAADRSSAKAGAEPPLLPQVSRGRAHPLPAPTIRPSEPRERMQARPVDSTSRPRKTTTRLRQGTLPLDVISRGRFDKTEPNIHRGEDLDTPTYLRRGCVLN